MDAMSNPEIEMIVMMTSSQVGKTSLLNNLIGFHIDQDPCPILLIQPTLDMAGAWSKERFAPMIRDTPVLLGKVSEGKAKDASNTIMAKTFVGGHLTVAGANSPASLAARPVRIVILDEVDRFPVSAGAEGDPVKLAIKRTATFWNRKIVATSTPTIKDMSRIESLFNSSLKHFYYVPCLKCNHYQVLQWGYVKFDHEDKQIKGMVTYECKECHARMLESDKAEMVRRGEWRNDNYSVGTDGAEEIADIEKNKRRHYGFHISELYSPWSSWEKIAQEFLESKGRRETLRVWTNTTLGETFGEEETQTISDEMIATRVEYYENVPAGVLFLTAGCDVQEDRLEVVVRGWGQDDESWFIDRKVMFGSTLDDSVWREFEKFLDSTYKHEYNFPMGISAICVDSGYRTTKVYTVVKQLMRKHRYIFATKGYQGNNKGFIQKLTYNNSSRARLLILGVDEPKRTIYDRLKIENPGAGYLHFNDKCDKDYFQQLVSEDYVTKYNKGFPYGAWIKKKDVRNEVLDCEVLNLAAKTIYNPNMEGLRKNLEKKRLPDDVEEKVLVPHPDPRKRFIQPKKGFVNSWR